MKKSSFIIAAAIVFITVAGRVSTAIGQVAGERQTLPVAVVTADPSNDLYKTLTANFDGVRLCKTLDEAVALRDDVKGVMILADNYPDQRTRVSSEQAEALLASDVRIYVEYPENNDALGIAGYDGVEAMSNRRGVVVDADKLQTPLYSLLYVNGALFAAKPFDAEKVGAKDNSAWLVCAKVAGYDVAEYALSGAAPFVLLEENGRVLTAATKFSQWISARYAPYERYQTFWASVLTWLDGGAPVPKPNYEPAVSPARSRDAVLTEEDYVDAVRRNADWFFNSGFLLSDADEEAYRTRRESREYSLRPDETCDGRNGVIETFSSGTRFKPDGSQKIRFLKRADCNAETAGALALAYRATGDGRYRDAAYNLVDWLLRESSLSGGPRADVGSPQYGFLDWDDGPTTPEQYYGDDAARAILGLIEAISVLGEDGEQFQQRLLELVLANFRTTGKNGFRGNNIHAKDLDARGWKYYYDREITNFAPHFEAMLWACYLWAYEHTRWEPLLRRTKTGIALMMDAYEKGQWRWTNGLQQERAKMILPLAWLVRLEPTEQHEEWLRRIVGDVMTFQQENGGIQERLGEGRGLFGSFKSNAAYGGAEGPIIQNNGDPCVDNLYTQPFALLGLNEAARATSDETNRKEYETYLRKLTDFVVKTQQVSDVYPEFNGVWFRAFDYDKWETYGSDGDLEWGVWTTETGWTLAWLGGGVSMRVGNACVWDLSASMDLTDDFEIVKEIMLKEIVDDENE
ncbi:MAG: hypothetical protein IK077_12245 [Thermoguttaceae bacterium]|nr:hypothetical protein [Thermoguttaceae bacterium]